MRRTLADWRINHCKKLQFFHFIHIAIFITQSDQYILSHNYAIIPAAKDCISRTNIY